MILVISTEGTMADTLLALLKNIRSPRRVLKAGDVLFRAGDTTQALFHVEQGEIGLSRGGGTMFIAGAGQPFAESALFTDTYGSDAIALSDASVLVFPKTAVLLLLKAHPDLNLAFSAYLARQADALRFQSEILRLKGARARVLAWLAHAGAAAGAITLDRPLTAVAHDLGLTREALYRTLAAMEAAGMLAREGRRTFRLKP